jgi:type IV pilus assembly protein PilW
MRAQRWNEVGFTLIELMIAVTLSTIIVAAGFATLTGGYKATRVSNLVSDTQQNARAAMDLIAVDLKAAGFGFIGQVGACATTGGVASPIVPFDNNNAGADTGPDRISMVVPSTNTLAAPLWQLTAPPGGPGISNITLLPAAVTAMLAALPQTPPPSLVGSTISIGGVTTATIGAVAGGLLTLNPAIVSPWGPGNGTQVYLLQCITYQVIPPPDPNVLCGIGNAPCLVRGVAPGVALDCNVAGSTCLPITNGIEDLQLYYGCDGCNPVNGIPDRIVDDQNGSGSFDQADFISNNTWAGTLAAGVLNPNTISLVQITIVAREAPQNAGQDQGFGEGNARATSTSAPLNLPDHNHANGVFVAGDLPAAGAAMTAYQQLRRRVLTRTVALRNVGN